MNLPETLFDAVEQGDLKRLKELIKSGRDVNEMDEETPLGKAAELGRVDLVRELLKAGADVDQGGLQSPICSAVHARATKVVDVLLKAGAAVDAQSEGGESALMLAAANGDLNLAKRLLKAGASAKLEDEDGQSAILYGRKWPRIVELLKPMSSAGDVEFVERESRRSSEQVEALLEAAKAGDAKRVKALLDAGAPVSGVNSNDETALHMAVGTHNDDLVGLLLEAGADVNARNSYGRTPLWEAVTSNDLKLIERLLAAGADVNVREKLEGKTPFLCAIGPQQEQLETMRLLAKHGAQVNVADDYGQTALSLARRFLCMYEEKEYEEKDIRQAAALRELLMELGILNRHADALTHAAGAGDLETVSKLLGDGVPVDAVDANERTALYMAVSRQQCGMVRALLKAGADVHKPVGSDPGTDGQWGGVVRACPACGHGFVSLLVERRCPQCAKSFSPREQEPNLDGALYFTWANGNLPLTTAAWTNNVEILTTLLDAGAEVNRGKWGITPLMVAAYFGHLDVARVLIERGADVKRECKTPDQLKKTISPVLLAAERKHIAMVKLLWDAGAPPRDKKPTLLLAAARNGDAREIERLIAEGADPNAPDPLTREWALCAAANVGSPAAVEALLNAGASATPLPRQTAPILMAVSGLEYKARLKAAPPEVVANHVEVVRLLLAAGANANVRFFGFSPLSVAEDLKCKPLIEVLKAAERPVSKPKRA